jgi:FdhD protein
MPPGEEAGFLSVRARDYRYDHGPTGPVSERAIAVETPINIWFGGIPFAVMMTTPVDLEDFAVGFAFTEGIIETLHDVRGVEIEQAAPGIKINIALAGERMSAHLSRGRVLSGRTGCGLCGVEDFAQLPKPRRAVAGESIAPAAIAMALRAMEANQPLNALTHSIHAAAWCDRAGALVALREDVGRHNALDKVIGALLRAGAAPADGFFVITSRCSFEMVAKAALFGASTLVAVSAPTSLAIERAQICGMTLIAVARADHAAIFTGPDAAASGGLAA